MPDQNLVPAPAPASTPGPDPLGLSAHERVAYDGYLSQVEQAKGKRYVPSYASPIGVEAQVGMFELYLAGEPLQAIRDRYKQFTLGQVVAAFVEGQWEWRRKERLKLLLDTAQERVTEVLAGGVDLVTLGMRATEKRLRDKLLLYLQTGNEEHLMGTGIGGLKSYKDLVDLLKTLTGGDRAAMAPPPSPVIPASTDAVAYGDKPTAILIQPEKKRALLSEWAARQQKSDDARSDRGKQ